jgi:hypothetical protein
MVGAGTTRASTVVANPGVEAGLIPMKMLLGQTEADAASLRIRLREAETQLAEMKPLSESVPEVQAELSKLTRDYNITKETYEKLVQRGASAELQSAGDMSQIKVIEAPRVPIIPVAPDRQLLTTAVLLASIVAGGALAWLRAQSNAAFYTRKQLVSFSDIPVLGSVGMEWTGLEIAKRRMGLLMFMFASALLFSIYCWQMINLGYDIKPLLQAIESIKQGVKL